MSCIWEEVILIFAINNCRIADDSDHVTDLGVEVDIALKFETHIYFQHHP